VQKKNYILELPRHDPVHGWYVTLYCADDDAKDFVEAHDYIQNTMRFSDGEKVWLYFSPRYNYEEAWVTLDKELTKFYQERLNPATWGEWAEL